MPGRSGVEGRRLARRLELVSESCPLELDDSEGLDDRRRRGMLRDLCRNAASTRSAGSGMTGSEILEPRDKGEECRGICSSDAGLDVIKFPECVPACKLFGTSANPDTRTGRGGGEAWREDKSRAWTSSLVAALYSLFDTFREPGSRTGRGGGEARRKTWSGD